jgi:hypothetical protein
VIGTIIALIILCAVLGVLVWGGQRLMALIPMGEPFRTIIYVLFVLLIMVLVIYVFIVLLGAIGISVPIFGGLR